MIDLLEHYISQSLDKCKSFTTNQNLKQKVSPEGRFLPYYGNTVVFDLSEDTKLTLQRLQESLYRAAWWMLSERLQPETFHMTLHDLVNGRELTDELKVQMKETKVEAEAILSQWQGQPPLRMKGTWLFNMVNTSIVLGLAPADEDTWNRLGGMYKTLETVVPLGYALTPHITMAYFKPGTYSQHDLNYLRQVLQPVELDVQLRLEDLTYCEFWNMNHYVSSIEKAFE